MDDSAVISVHWWVTMALLCMLALNQEKRLKKKRVKLSFKGRQRKLKKEVLLPLKFCHYDKISTTNTSVLTENLSKNVHLFPKKLNYMFSVVPITSEYAYTHKFEIQALNVSVLLTAPRSSIKLFFLNF